MKYQSYSRKEGCLELALFLNGTRTVQEGEICSELGRLRPSALISHGSFVFLKLGKIPAIGTRSFSLVHFGKVLPGKPASIIDA